jgi:hypothetical protein
METIYFLIFVGLCAFGVVWVTRSRSKIDLAPKRKARAAKAASDKLATPLDNRLSHKEQIWETRQTRASKGFTEDQTFVPKSVAGDAPQYDGYSRRDRHHVAPTGKAKEHIHDEKEGFAITGSKLGSRDHAHQT